MADLLTAIQTLANKLIPNTTGDKKLAYTLRLAEYSARLAGQSAPLKAAVEPEAEADVPLSSDPSTALHQILASTGHPVQIIDGWTQALDPVAVLKDATDEQQRELALLGFFGQKGSRTDVDYSLWEQYYDQDPSGNAAPKEQYASTGTWQAYLAGKGS